MRKQNGVYTGASNILVMIQCFSWVGYMDVHYIIPFAVLYFEIFNNIFSLTLQFFPGKKGGSPGWSCDSFPSWSFLPPKSLLVVFPP